MNTVYTANGAQPSLEHKGNAFKLIHLPACATLLHLQGSFYNLYLSADASIYTYIFFKYSVLDISNYKRIFCHMLLKVFFIT